MNERRITRREAMYRVSMIKNKKGWVTKMCLWITRKKCRDREIDRELAELQLRMAKLEDRDKSNSVERKLADLVSVRYEYEVVYGCLTNYTPRRKQLKDKGWTLVGYIKESDAEVWINSKELINA